MPPGRPRGPSPSCSAPGMVAVIGANSADELPWSWKECILVRVYEAHKFYLMHRALRSEQVGSSVPPNVNSKVSSRRWAWRCCATAASLRRLALARLVESANCAQSRRSSGANELGNGQDVVTPQPPEVLVYEKAMAEDGMNAPIKNLPYPFLAFDHETAANKNKPVPSITRHTGRECTRSR